MTTSPGSFRIGMQDALYSPVPFYNQLDYAETTKADFSQDSPSFPCDYIWDSEGTICRGIRRAVTAFPPCLIAAGTHTIAGNCFFLPASAPSKRRQKEIKDRRNNIDLSNEWKYRRISVLVNGCKVDGAVLGKESTLNNRQWVIVANGNNSRYETALYNENSDIKKILAEIGYNGLVFSYPGVGSSKGFAGKKAMVNAHLAMLSFTVDKKDGIGAEKVILYGYSTGGGIQAEMLSKSIPPQVKLAIKDRSFSSFSRVAMENHRWAQTPVKYAVKALGWNVQTLNSSKGLPIPEIVLQSIQSDTDTCEIITNVDQIIDDGKIPAKAALATGLLTTLQISKAEKVFLGLPEKHSDKLADSSVQQLTSHITRLLTPSGQV